jgi:hypothetical protein
MFMIFLYLLVGGAIGIGGLFLLVGVDYNFTNPNNKALRDFDRNPDDWKELEYNGFLHKSGLLLLDGSRIKTYTEKQTGVDPYNTVPGVILGHSDSQQKRYESIIKSRQEKLARQRVKVALEGEKAAAEEKKKEEKLGFFEARKVKSLGTF